MARYKVFLGAPTLGELESTGASDKYAWTSVKCEVPPLSERPTQGSSSVDSFSFNGFFPGTLEAASRRISMLYENIIFREIDSEGEEEFVEEAATGEPGVTSENVTRITQGHTTWITWDPTMAETTRRETTFLRGTVSFGRSRLPFETQETQDTDSYARSEEYSSDPSVTRFPVFHFPLHSLVPLAALEHGGTVTYPGIPSNQGNKRKVDLLVAVFEIEGPDTIRIKRGVDAGKEVSVLKVIVSEPSGTVCRLTAWREVADRWGGNYSDSGEASLKRGDIVYLQNILVTKETSTAVPLKDNQKASTVSLTASPALNSAMAVCYRTMPEGNDPMDQKLRPDLRLGFSDAAVRHVADIVSWFQSTAGLPFN